MTLFYFYFLLCRDASEAFSSSESQTATTTSVSTPSALLASTPSAAAATAAPVLGQVDDSAVLVTDSTQATPNLEVSNVSSSLFSPILAHNTFLKIHT